MLISFIAVFKALLTIPQEIYVLGKGSIFCSFRSSKVDWEHWRSNQMPMVKGKSFAACSSEGVPIHEVKLSDFVDDYHGVF
jgi:hypothetical protein